MDNITLQLEQLRNRNQESRLKACKELEMATNLPPEAITALEQACDDTDLVVAWAASRALFSHRKYEAQSTPTPEPSSLASTIGKTAFTSRKIFGWLLFLVAFFVLIGVSGSPVDLRCSRVEPRGPVNCVKQTRLLGILPLHAQIIYNVRSARVSESDDYEGDTGYRIELLTAGSMVPLRNVYISDYSGKSAKDELASQINNFVRSAVPGTLAVTEPGLLNIDNVFCSLTWLLFVAAGSYLWRKIRSAFGRTQGSAAKQPREAS